MSKPLKDKGNDVSQTVSFFDIFHLARLAKSKMIAGAVLFGLLAILYSATRPVEYEAISSYREQPKSQSGVSNNLLSSVLTMGTSSSNASEAISLLKSRKLLVKLIQQLGIQASLDKHEIRFNTFKKIRDNVVVEFAYQTNKQEPVVEDVQPQIYIRDVKFSNEFPLNLNIKLISEEAFEWVGTDGSTKIVNYGEPVAFDDVSFTLFRNLSQPFSEVEYTIRFTPLFTVLKNMIGKLTIETDRDDKLLIKLKYACGNRQQAVECLNALMDIYQEHLRGDQQRILKEQIAYLQERQDRMQDKLQKMMEAHAANLTSDAVSTGFLNSGKAMEFLAENLQQYNQSLVAIDLEQKQLARAQKEGPSAYDHLSADNENTPISQILSSIRGLKQQADSLDLSLRETETDQQDAVKNFAQQSSDLEKIKKLTNEASLMLASLEKGIVPDMTLSLYREPKFMVQAWCDQLLSTPKKSSEWTACQNNFKSYLLNLIHLFQVHAKAIQERLTHQQSAPLEFQGLNLETSQSLYLDYTRQINSIETSLLQYQFIIDKMKASDFEMSSLSAMLTDSVSKDMIAQTTQSTLALKDQKNRSTKELERLQQDIDRQKGFLTAHLQQTMNLQQIQKQLIQDKLRSLQSAILGLTQQQISILQDHLTDYLETRNDNLDQKREVIIQHQRELQQEMTKWPSQWVSELLIEQQMEVNKKMVEEVTKLVESKNITSNLEVIRSAPVDLAVTAPLPKQPKILFMAVLGVLLGSLLPLAWMTIRSLTKGMPVTAANLKMSQLDVSGSLSKNYKSDSSKPLFDQDLNTLRHVIAFLDNFDRQKAPGVPLGNRVLIIKGNGPDFSKDLCKLLSKKGMKVLLLPLTFESAEGVEQPGLLQYLENRTILPLLIKEEGYERVPSGGISRYTTELLGSPAFKDLLLNLEKHYDWIISINSAPVQSAETENILQLYPNAVVTITDETWPDLERCLALQKHVTFVMKN